jgi:uncharacterized repeat protein (TIGR02543 family)
MNEVNRRKGAVSADRARRRYQKKKRIRRHRYIIPLYVIILLLVGGQVYTTVKSGEPSFEKFIYSFGELAGISGEAAATAENKNAEGQETGEAAEKGKSAEGGESGEDVKPATVTFYAGDENIDQIQIKRDGSTILPLPEKNGYEFAGWYTERTGGQLINESNAAWVPSGYVLYARWNKVSEGEDHAGNGVPVLMYHWFYDTEKGDAAPTSLLNNWMTAAQFDEEIAWLKGAGYYFPTWDEFHAFVKGEIDLPVKSIVVTVDDGRKSFFEYAVPIFEKYKVRGTGFLIASKMSKKKVDKYKSEYVSMQSHTYDMHNGHGGKGLIQTLPKEQATADLASAAAILGTTDALAYPYGYFDDVAVNICKEVGIRMAFGISGGNVFPGMDPLRLPRVRISSNQPTDSFKVSFPE